MGGAKAAGGEGWPTVQQFWATTPTPETIYTPPLSRFKCPDHNSFTKKPETIDARNASVFRSTFPFQRNSIQRDAHGVGGQSGWDGPLTSPIGTCVTTQEVGRPQIKRRVALVPHHPPARPAEKPTFRPISAPPNCNAPQ